MTQNKHFNATVRNRKACTGQTYTQALRDVLQQLKYVAEFGHLAVMWDAVNDRGLASRPPVENHRAALGAVELGIRDTGILEGATMRDHWRTLDGHIDLDWKGGPYAVEVVRALISHAEDPVTPTLYPGELRPGINRLGDLDAVWIYGVRVRFRPYCPIGAEASRRLAWAQLRDRATVQGTNREQT